MHSPGIFFLRDRSTPICEFNRILSYIYSILSYYFDYVNVFSRLFHKVERVEKTLLRDESVMEYRNPAARVIVKIQTRGVGNT